MPKNPKPRKTRIDAMPDVDIAKALRACKGKQVFAADMLKMDMGTISARIKISPYLQQVRAECEERRLDVAEGVLDRCVEDLNLTATIFLLKTKGKHRGYVETAPVIVSQDILKSYELMNAEVREAQEARKRAKMISNNECKSE